MRRAQVPTRAALLFSHHRTGAGIFINVPVHLFVEKNRSTRYSNQLKQNGMHSLTYILVIDVDSDQSDGKQVSVLAL